LNETPAYQLRRSARARHVRLTVSMRHGLVITLPHRFPLQQLPSILRDKSAWIADALRKVEQDRVHWLAECRMAQQLPETIELPALGRRWRLLQQPSTTARLRLREQGDLLLMCGNASDHEAAIALLRRWLRRKAAEVLPAQLSQLAAEHELRHGPVSIRSQRRRWGSCARNGAISLNDRLLFLPPELARHVLLHELAHLREHHHGPAFHRLLAALDPECLLHTARMRRAGDLVPLWARDLD